MHTLPKHAPLILKQICAPAAPDRWPAYLSICLQDHHVVDFITKFHAMQQVIWMLFHLSIYALLAAILLAVHYNYKAYMAWVITASALFFGAVSMYCCSTVRCSVRTKGDPLGSSVCVTIVRRTDWNHMQSTASTC